MERWKGRVALVTGASAGIGYAIAKSLSMIGMRVVACARRLDKLESLETLAKKESHSGKIYPVQCDLANLDDIRKLFKFIEGHPELGKVDVSVCNAGMVVPKGLKDLSPGEMHQMMDVNLMSPTIVTQSALKLMLKTNVTDGHLIFVSSIAAHPNQITIDENTIGFWFYAATKQGLNCLLEFWRKEIRTLGNNSIRIGAVSPGVTKTEGHEDLIGDEQIAKDFYAANLHLEAQDVADAVICLLSAKPHVQIHDVIIRNTHEK